MRYYRLKRVGGFPGMKTVWRLCNLEGFGNILDY